MHAAAQPAQPWRQPAYLRERLRAGLAGDLQTDGVQVLVRAQNSGTTYAVEATHGRFKTFRLPQPGSPAVTSAAAAAAAAPAPRRRARGRA